MASPTEGLARLRRAARSGTLDALCARYGVQVLTVFGSAARGAAKPRDLDIGILFEMSARPDPLALIAELTSETDADVDVVTLNAAGALLRERALVGSIALFESTPGAWSRAATAAACERMDTDWMRRLDLELLARS